MIEWASKTGELEAKHGVKMVSGWLVQPEYWTVQVFEAPTFEAMLAYSMEPEVMNIMNWNTIEFKVAKPLEETMKMVQAQ